MIKERLLKYSGSIGSNPQAKDKICSNSKSKEKISSYTTKPQSN